MPQPAGQQAGAAFAWAGERGRKWVENLAATERMLAPVDAPLLAALSLDDVQRVADIGCGGGQTSRAIANALAPGAQVHGVDVSPDVIAAAERATAHAFAAQTDTDTDTDTDVAAAEAAQLQFFCTDAGGARPPATAHYQRLSSRFGVMFFDQPASAFANLARWLVPGGRFAFAVWGPLPSNPWMACLREVVAELVELPEPVPDAPGPFRYGDAGRFCALLEGAGFQQVSAAPWMGKLALGGGLSAAAAADFCLRAFSMGELLGDDKALLALAQTRLRERFDRYEDAGQVVIPAHVHIVTGLAPA